MTTPTIVLSNARKWLGTVEHPPKSNRTPIGEKFGWNGVAWCAETVSVVLLDSGFKINKNASARGLHDELVKEGWHVVPAAKAQSGDILFFDWPTEPGNINHTGFCEGRKSDGRLITIEGNTSISATNDGVARKVRALSCISAVVRPPYAGASTHTNTAPALHLGDKGNWVKVLQKHIGGVTVDGIYGPATEKRVKEFQKNHNIHDEAIVGPSTWKALGL